MTDETFDDASLIKLRIQKRGGVIQSYWVTEKTAKEKYLYSQKKDAFIKYQANRKIAIDTDAGKKTVTHAQVKYLFKLQEDNKYVQYRMAAPGDYLKKGQKMPKVYQIEVSWQASSYDRHKKGKWYNTKQESFSYAHDNSYPYDQALREAKRKAEEQAAGWHTSVTGEGESDEPPDKYRETRYRVVAWVG